jgi:hypothetical protein
MVQVSLSNLSSLSPSFIPLLVTAKTTTTMTVSWNVPLEDGNYQLEYLVKKL